MEKKEIRKKVFQVRKSSDPQELEKKSQLINQKIIEQGSMLSPYVGWLTDVVHDVAVDSLEEGSQER